MCRVQKDQQNSLPTATTPTKPTTLAPYLVYSPLSLDRL